MDLCTLSLVYTVLQRYCTNEIIVQPRVSSVPTRSYSMSEQTKSDKQYQGDLVGQNSIHVTTSTVLQSVEAELSKVPMQSMHRKEHINQRSQAVGQPQRPDKIAATACKHERWLLWLVVCSVMEEEPLQRRTCFRRLNCTILSSMTQSSSVRTSIKVS